MFFLYICRDLQIFVEVIIVSEFFVPLFIFSAKLIDKYSLQGIGEYKMPSRKTRSQIIEFIKNVRGGIVCQNTKERAACLMNALRLCLLIR